MSKRYDLSSKGAQKVAEMIKLHSFDIHIKINSKNFGDIFSGFLLEIEGKSSKVKTQSLVIKVLPSRY